MIHDFIKECSIEVTRAVGEEVVEIDELNVECSTKGARISLKLKSHITLYYIANSSDVEKVVASGHVVPRRI